MDTSNIKDDSLFSEVGNFYLNNDKLHDVQFIVGEQKETMKAVRLPLINQSKAWWSMLSEDSPLGEKGDIHLPDIDPEVFTLLLKHSYGGLSNLDDLSDDMVMKLCYCANKYFMTSLFEKISIRLQPKDVKGLFPALHCLVYYNLQGVEEGVKKMVRTQTTKILVHPEFLECDPDSVTYICKQETLNCDELSLWKAVVQWAKHKAQSGEGAQLRQWMSSALQHIRLITLSATDLRDHVFCLDILNSKEIVSICIGDVSDLSTLCNVKIARYFVKTVDIKPTVTSRNRWTKRKSSSYSFVIGDQCINLTSLVVRGVGSNSERELSFPLNMTSVDVSVKITRVGNVMNLSKNLENKPITFEVINIEHYVGYHITVPTLIKGMGITLQANSKYKLQLSFSQELPCWYIQDHVKGFDFDRGGFFCSSNVDGMGETYCHILQFTYQAANE